jgi:hypothetical protein
MFHLFPESMQSDAIRTSISRVSILLVCRLRSAAVNRSMSTTDFPPATSTIPGRPGSADVIANLNLYLREMTLEKRLNDEMFIFGQRLLRLQLVESTGRQ